MSVCVPVCVYVSLCVCLCVVFWSMTRSPSRCLWWWRACVSLMASSCSQTRSLCSSPRQPWQGSAGQIQPLTFTLWPLNPAQITAGCRQPWPGPADHAQHHNLYTFTSDLFNGGPELSLWACQTRVSRVCHCHWKTSEPFKSCFPPPPFTWWLVFF